MRRLLFFLTVLLSFNLQAQWVQQADFGGAERFGAIDFTIDGEAYILGGIRNIDTSFMGFDELWKYDPVNDSWSQQAPYPGGNIYDGVAFVIGSKAYVGLGSDENGIRNSLFWAYDSQTGQWSSIAIFPRPSRKHACAFSAQGKGYVGGGTSYLFGTSPITERSFWEYDPVMDSWRQVADYPGGGFSGLAAITINDKGYVGMGSSFPSSLSHYPRSIVIGSENDFYHYNVNSDSWTSLSPFPGDNIIHQSTTSANDKGYLLGGTKRHRYTKQMWSYDPSMDSWDTAFAFTDSARVSANLFFVNNAFYFGLGLTDFPRIIVKSFWKYQLSSIGIADQAKTLRISAYPNPTSGALQIDLHKTYAHVRVEVSNALGQNYANYDFNNRNTLDLRLEVPKGLYFIRLITSDFENTFRVLKE